MNYQKRFNSSLWQARASDLKQSGQIIFGYAALFNVLSQPLGDFREKIAKGAFAKTILEDDIKMLFNHDQNFLLARTKSGTLKLKEDEKGLYFEAIPPDTQSGKDLLVLIRRGDLSQNSFGFSILDESLVRTGSEKIRILRQVRLYDISPVTFPAYLETSLGVKDSRQVDRRRLEILDSKFFEAEGLPLRKR